MNNFGDLPKLKQWVFLNKFHIKTSEYKQKKDKPTHFLLDGGIWKIPMSHYDEFLRLFAQDLQEGEKYYISENKTDVFKFIVDLDFFDTLPISLDYVTGIVGEFQSIIKEYFGAGFNVVVCGTDNKQVNDRVKSGFHLVWPKLWVTVESAKAIRKLFVEHISLQDTGKEWNDIIDACIYEQNGLRMVGSRKIGICKQCKNKKDLKESCQACDSTGRKDEGRVYKPVCILDSCSNRLDDYLKNDWYLILLETSIINYNNFEEVKPVKNLPVVNDKSRAYTPVQGLMSNNKDLLLKKVENFIKKNLKCYAKTELKNYKKLNNEVYIFDSSDNFCQNVNRNHTSSGIYFLVKRSGVCQKCYCKKNNCNAYASKTIPLSKILENQLFGKVGVSKIMNTTVFNVSLYRNKELYIKNLENQLMNSSL